MLNSFNNISPYYDILSRLVFGNSLFACQIHLINYLPKKGRLAIIGGGNGKILARIYRHAPDLEILFVEASSDMITHAKNNQYETQNVTYSHNSSFQLDNFCPNLIFLPFILDMYNENEIHQNIKSLIAQSQPNTKWYLSDFSKHKISNGGWFNKARLQMSIKFFNITTGHKLKYLPDIFSILEKSGLKPLNINNINSPFLKSQIYITE